INALNLPLLFRFMVSGFIETSASITAGVAVVDAPGGGEAVAVGEGVVTGVGVAVVVDSEIIPSGTSIVSLVFVDTFSTCAAAVEVPVGVGDAVTVGVAVEVPVGVGDTVTVGVAVGELVGDAVTVGVGVVDVTLLITTLVISSLSSLLRSSRVNSSSAFPSVIVNDLEYVFGLSLISVSITRILSWLTSSLSGENRNPFMDNSTLPLSFMLIFSFSSSSSSSLLIFALISLSSLSSLSCSRL